jgi:hypothetical protein
MRIVHSSRNSQLGPNNKKPYHARTSPGRELITREKKKQYKCSEADKQFTSHGEQGATPNMGEEY